MYDVLNAAPDEKVAARQLYYLLNQKLWLDWEEISDRPDAISPGTLAQKGNNPQARKNVKIGQFPYQGRDIALRLQRFRLTDGTLIWLFSPRTVFYTPKLYKVHGPSEITRHLPEWLQEPWYLDVPLWQWFSLPIILLISFAIGLLIRNVAKKLLADSRFPHSESLANTTHLPIALVFGSLALYLFTKTIFDPSGPPGRIIDVLLIITIVSSFLWLGMAIVGYFANFAHDSISDDMDLEQDTEKKKKLTMISVMRRVFIFVVVMVGTGVILLELEVLQSIGTGLLTSAGVMGVVVAIAAQATLGNIIAGLQIAISKPAAIGDTVSFEGNWAHVEDITYTYITLRTWDLRRVIVPLRYFISHPFENWSKTESSLVKPIYLYADYTVPVEKIRAFFEDYLPKHELWDEGQEPSLQVYSVTEKTVRLRALCSGKDASTAWELHCDVREALIKYLRELDDGKYLPREREVNLSSAAHSNS